MVNRVAALLFAAVVVLPAAEFQSGQAARAVIGQPSFSAHDGSVNPIALSISKNRLFVADASHRVLTFDLSRLPTLYEDGGTAANGSCPVCLASPSSLTAQSVFKGVAAVGVYGKTVVEADTSTHRVLIWRDSSSPRAIQGPDVVLSGSADRTGINASTLVEPVSVAYDGKRMFVGDAGLHRVLVWNSLPASADQPADAVLGQPDFTTANIADVPAADTIRNPTALASDGINLYISDAPDHRILVFTPGDAALGGTAAVNSASLLPGPLAPGALVSITGNGLADFSHAVEEGTVERLPTKLAGVEVLFDGTPLPLLSVAPTQIQLQLPYNLANISAASLYVRTEHSDGSTTATSAISLKVLSAAPGLFAFSGTEPREGILLHAEQANGTQGTPVTTDEPAKPGETITIWATGLGSVNGADFSSAAVAGAPYEGPAADVSVPVDAEIEGTPAEVISARLPKGAVGIYEVRIAVPANLRPGEKAQLLISQNGIASNIITFAVGASLE